MGEIASGEEMEEFINTNKINYLSKLWKWQKALARCATVDVLKETVVSIWWDDETCFINKGSKKKELDENA